MVEDFYIVAYEWGAENPTIETWGCEKENVVSLDEHYSGAIKKLKVEALPGAFQLLHVLTPVECEKFLEVTQRVGYIEDAAVSLPRSVRHNYSLTWVVDERLHNIIWERCKPFMEDEENIFQNKKALGLNKRFRFYKYEQGDYFSLHTDGAWPGSAIRERKLITDNYGDRFSKMTFLLFLSDDFEGGETSFLVDRKNKKYVDVRTPKGGVLCFPHGTHPLHALHASKEVRNGVKYIIRSDVLYEK